MENHKLVLPEHLNHYGYLFGGHLLKWVDECAWIAATLDYPGCSFVTLAMDRVEFRRSVRQGTVLRFEIERVRQGTTSVQYRVTVYDGKDRIPDANAVFTTHVTFVRVDDAGRKTPLPEAG
ncbi:MAG: acyl-CoA thioesterase [Lentisphaerae bacterium RIFOXYB12_FULL_65_16]|nr:MAG: acyl-CoA thioesterase [Lentisphaerae bacterium RIFOXYA12_64_32]OGV85952.1 MAG: acyl-CoA thioesterase [Lentisphaerae bacterium RIFOXYB12_FULL_65_16]